MVKNRDLGTIATHNGIFHHDEVFAVAALKRIDPDAKIIRSRNPAELKSADIRVDVGGVYDYSSGDYDHHQREGAGERENGVPYSSFGLVWKHYGAEASNGSEEVAKFVDESLVQRVDGVDTGYFNFDVSDGPAHLYQAIGGFNPSWHEDGVDRESAFDNATDFASQILNSTIKSGEGVKLTKGIMTRAFENSADHPDYLILERFCPWQKHASEGSNALFTIFPNLEGNYMIGAVPNDAGARGKNRLDLPESWAGLKDNEFESETGVEGAVFCHNSRFIAGAKTLPAAISLTELALKNGK